MEKTDARRLRPETQEQIRRQAIRLKKKGMSFTAVGEIVGVHRHAVSKWWKTYKKEGSKGLKPRKRGRRMGEHRNLTPKQEKEIQTLICDKVPEQMKLAFALWTRRAVKEVIKLRTGQDMPIRTVGEYLRRWGFTPQKPIRQAYEQCPKKVRKWLSEEYPKITKQAKREDAEIHWGDETGIRNNSQHGRSYSPRGQTPVIRLSAKRITTNMISTVTNQGKVRFMIYEGTMNAKCLIRFLRQLIKSAKKKIFLILDNLRVHHAKVVKVWLEKDENKKKIEVFYLPSYSLIWSSFSEHENLSFSSIFILQPIGLGC